MNNHRQGGSTHFWLYFFGLLSCLLVYEFLSFIVCISRVGVIKTRCVV